MYDETFWNQRYAQSNYVYGTEPNSFLADHHIQINGNWGWFFFF